MLVRTVIFALCTVFAAAASAQKAATGVPAPLRAVSLDRVVAIVNDEAITQYELDEAKRLVVEQLKQQKVAQPSQDVLDKQVLERIVTERALLQYAKESGIKVDDNMVERTIQRIAEDNKLTLDGLRQALAKDNVT